MQGFAREIYLTFKSANEKEIPVLLSVMDQTKGISNEVHCGGMIISNRNRFEKELLVAKNVAEAALSKNVDLLEIRAELESHQRELEMQLRKLSALHRQQHDIFKVIAHDLQEPLRKAVFFADLIKSQNTDLPENVTHNLDRIIVFNEHMCQMVLSLQRIEELDNRKINLQTVKLQSLIESAVLSLNIDQSKIKIEYQLACHSFSGDQELLENMFIELFLNSDQKKGIYMKIL